LNSLESVRGSAQLSLRAVLDTLPLAVAVIPWGILIGALSVQIGLTPWQGMAMSLLVFAGAAQLSGMSLMASAAAPSTIFVSTFVISARHLLYSVTFRQHVLRLPFFRRLLIGFLLTDEMFAVSQAHTHRSGVFSPLFAMVSGLSFYIVWNLATLVGIMAGDSFKDLNSLGLDFAIVATFIAMTFDRLREFPTAIAIVVSGVTAVFLKPYLAESYIIIGAVAGMLAAYVVGNSENGSTEKSSV